MNFEKGNKTEKKSLKSTQMTIDMTECIENSAGKDRDKRLSSPSVIKPTCHKSPSPRVIFKPVNKKPNLDKIKEFSVGNRPQKRKINDCLNTEKKRRAEITHKTYVEFYDPEIKDALRFECFLDKILEINSEMQKKFPQNECDDDCATSSKLLEISRQYLIDQVTTALESYVKKDTL